MVTEVFLSMCDTRVVVMWGSEKVKIHVGVGNGSMEGLKNFKETPKQKALHWEPN